ncbi:MAG: MBL fold metallo-hydrolase [Candidatus Altiarchaeota archaeon]|nr:MBL fold metallo-hydrolase [Candidatus Altiarchaeota archaeon]
MKIIPLAFDSMGSRSMATYVETGDVKVLIDPGVSLSPNRFKLSPHPREVRRMKKQWRDIKRHAKRSDVLVVTHYHYDHHDPDEVDIYRDKIVMLKHPHEYINRSQISRSKYFLKNLEGLPQKIYFSDNKKFSFNETTIKFSEPMPHGLHDRLGYVTEVLMMDGRTNTKFIHTSDVLGPCTGKQTEFIIDENPEVVFTDGPMNFTLKPAVENLSRIIRETDVKKLIIDHHLLRDINWRNRIREVFTVAEKEGGKTKIMTAAKFAGKKNDLFEAGRKELYGLL